jgi:pimeloyl-ACP methyl ester carboxylesterase
MSAQGQSGDLAPSPAERLFIEVEGVRLHYGDRGSGRPVVLIHSNIVTGDDYNTSGVTERLLGTRRVIIFDRPGYGYSERPRWRPWTAITQGELLHKALRELGVERPVIVGHSWAGRYPALHHLAGLRLAHDVGHQARDVRAGAGRGKVPGGVLHCYGLAAVADPGDMR